MADVDLDTLNKANKGLIVFFIISIVFVNLHLILRTVIRGGVPYSAKSLIVISLAIGDIFLALIPGVVNARYLYEADTFDPQCSTYTVYKVYLYYLIHFVYGVGLVVLAVELVYRYKRQSPAGNNANTIARAVIYSAVPWILGLIIVLPLTMVDTLFQGCLFDVKPSRYRAMSAVSVLLPAGLAVVVCIVVMCIRLVPTPLHLQVISHQTTTPGVVIATQSVTIELQQYPMNDLVGMQQMPTAQPATYYNHIDNEQPKPAGQEVIPSISQYILPQQPAQQAAQSNEIITASENLANSQNPKSPVLQDPGREKNVLLIVSIVYFISVVPSAVCKILRSDFLDQTKPTPIDYSISTALLWLSVFRSAVTPIIWMVGTRHKTDK